MKLCLSGSMAHPQILLSADRTSLTKRGRTTTKNDGLPGAPQYLPYNPGPAHFHSRRCQTDMRVCHPNTLTSTRRDKCRHTPLVIATQKKSGSHKPPCTAHALPRRRCTRPLEAPEY